MLIAESPIRLADVATLDEPKIRALHVINGEHYSGAERVQDLLALRLPEFGVETAFAALKPGRFEYTRQSRVPLYDVPMRSRWDLSVAKRLTHLVREHHFDLLHAHAPRGALVASLAARRAGVPLVYHIHSPATRDSTHRVQNWMNGRVERWALRRAAQLIAVSPSLQQTMIAAGFPAERVTCILNGVPASTLQPKHAPNGMWTLAMIALFRPRKGTEALLKALAILRKHNSPVRLRAVGGFESPQYEVEMHQLAERLGVADMITWVGFTSDVTNELAQTDLLVLPSLFGEGLPMVVLEAMAAGIPVVASEVEGVREAVIDGATGRLVKPGSAVELAAAIDSIVNGGTEYEALAHAAQARHVERFSDRIMAEQVASVYRAVVRNAVPVR